jgi:hypothetical protein
MGRYLAGTKGFSFKYASGQDSNLRELDVESGAGTATLVPVFVAPLPALERNEEIDCVPLALEIVRDTRAGGEIRGVLARGRALPGRPTLEFIQYAMAQNLVEVLRRIDLRLPAPASALHMVGYARYELSRAHWAQLLDYVNRALPTGGTRVDLAAFKTPARVRSATEALLDSEAFLPALALAILAHAVANDLDVVEVEERDAGVRADELWDLVLNDWGPPIFSKELPAEHDALFARGLVLLFAGQQKEAVEALLRGHELGDPRARRWLGELGVPVKALARSAVRYRAPDFGPRDAAFCEEIEELIGSREASARAWAAAQPVSKALDDRDQQRALATFRALPRDAKRKIFRVRAGILNAALNHGSEADILEVLEGMLAVRPQGADDPVMAYNFACASARLRDKASMLRWLAEASESEQAMAGALEDPDLAAFRDDPDFRRVVLESVR